MRSTLRVPLQVFRYGPTTQKLAEPGMRIHYFFFGQRTFTRKWLAMLGTGRGWTKRAAEYGSSLIDPTTPAAREHCRAFLPFSPLRFEAD